jgi:hypothetical protein
MIARGVRAGTTPRIVWIAAIDTISANPNIAAAAK